MSVDEQEAEIAVANRRLKALAMVEAIDRSALKQKPPLNPYDDAGKILIASFGWSDDVWLKIAQNAGYKSKKTPGPKSRKLVREIYEGRANEPRRQQVAS